MIAEFLWFVLLISVVVGLAFWRVWRKKRSNPPGEPESMDRHDGSLPDSFFDVKPNRPLEGRSQDSRLNQVDKIT